MEAETAVEDFANSVHEKEKLEELRIAALKLKPFRRKIPLQKKGSEKSFFFKDHDIKKVKYDLKPIFAAEINSYQFGVTHQTQSPPSKLEKIRMERRGSQTLERIEFQSPSEVVYLIDIENSCVPEKSPTTKELAESSPKKKLNFFERRLEKSKFSPNERQASSPQIGEEAKSKFFNIQPLSINSEV